VNLLAVFCILNWRIFWLTMTDRISPDADPELVFTDLELRILNRLVNDKPTAKPAATLALALSDQAGEVGRLSGAQLGLSTRKRNDLERINPSCRHPTRRHAGSTTCG
jgi:hypothetical protein